jgi:rod shape-determining protein MreD
MKSFQFILKGLPFFTLIVTILAGSAVRLGEYPMMPAIFLIPVYYWLVFRPDRLPLWSLFGAGLFYDALMNHELGLSSFLLMASAIFGHSIRPFLIPHNFLFMWAIFGIYSLLYLTIYGIFVSGGLPFLVSWGYGLLFYPLMAFGLSHLQLRLQSYA